MAKALLIPSQVIQNVVHEEEEEQASQKKDDEHSSHQSNNSMISIPGHEILVAERIIDFVTATCFCSSHSPAHAIFDPSDGK